MMSRWAELAARDIETSFVVARDTSRLFSSVHGLLPSPMHRVTFDGRFDNRRLVYEQSAASIRSPTDYLVANDVLELGMIAELRLPNPVAFALHGDYDYYYDLALRHRAQIGSFLCVSTFVQNRLKELIPDRSEDVHLTYPIVPEPTRTRVAAAGETPLRLLFVGRLTEEKGFFDLPRIDSVLKRENVAVAWTVVARASDELTSADSAWLAAPHVRHISMISPDKMESIYAAHDVLVFPSRYEGFGMAVIEAMKGGMVPIASRLDAGIPEMIDDGRSGFLTKVGDYLAMAATIARLSGERSLLETVGSAARHSALERFGSRDAAERLTTAVLSARSGPHAGAAPPDYLSRLDRHWLPNPVVSTTRKALRRFAPH